MRILVVLAIALTGCFNEPNLGDVIRDWSAAVCVRSAKCRATQISVGVCAINVEAWYCKELDCLAPYEPPADFDACLETYMAASCDETPPACVPHGDD